MVFNWFKIAIFYVKFMIKRAYFGKLCKTHNFTKRPIIFFFYEGCLMS